MVLDVARRSVLLRGVTAEQNRITELEAMVAAGSSERAAAG